MGSRPGAGFNNAWAGFDSQRNRPLAAARSPRAATLAAIGASLVVAACSWTAHDVHADGIAWQVDNTTTNPAGNWQILGIHDLLIQWTVVDDTAFIANTRIQPAAHLPDWERIGRLGEERDPGPRRLPDEKRARTHLSTLADQSLEVAHATIPLHVTGYYFPVEIDPTGRTRQSSPRSCNGCRVRSG